MRPPARQILIRYFKGASTPEECELVELYLSMDSDRDYVESCIAEVWYELGDDIKTRPDADERQKFQDELARRTKVLQQFPPSEATQMPTSTRWGSSWWIKTIAASLILIGVAASIVYFKQFHSNTLLVQDKPVHEDIDPGSEKAILTLADGSKVSLSDTKTGSILRQNGLRIEKTGAGEIVYSGSEGAPMREKAFNSVATPNGGQYSITLPDGSKAWLNAASSLTYPVQFAKHERRVKMTGEVYFEIEKAINAKKERIPFYVETDKQEIHVLGTHFNVNAYSNEPYTATTLLEGRVQVTALQEGRSVFLQPGEEARLGTRLDVYKSNNEEAIAWKSGDFYFDEEELSSILRKIARWYDVDVQCSAALGKKKLTGVFSRSAPLSTIIEGMAAIQSIKIKYVTKERRIVVDQ